MKSLMIRGTWYCCITLLSSSAKFLQVLVACSNTTPQ
uniref:Uncharacterized protein n=1 Tax=Anguilla anguilla TaxID=7936 RepID=A0A0E9V6Z5_ANGAN